MDGDEFAREMRSAAQLHEAGRSELALADFESKGPVDAVPAARTL
jgi:hypothetical protein